MYRRYSTYNIVQINYGIVKHFFFFLFGLHFVIIVIVIFLSTKNKTKKHELTIVIKTYFGNNLIIFNF